MQVETEDLITVIGPIVWPIFSAVMALRYPTQALRVAASTPTLSILQRGPTYQTAVRNFTCLRLKLTYREIKDRKHVEYNFTAIIRARARCALPMLMEFKPVAWLHIPLDPHTGAVDSFAGWDAPVVLRILATIIQRLGGRKRGEAPSGLHYPYNCVTSRIYCNRAEPRIQTTAREPNRSTLPITAEVLSNPRAALEIFLNLHRRQKEREQSISEDYAGGFLTFKSLFVQYGHQELADSLPELHQGSATGETDKMNATALGSSQPPPLK